MDLGVALLIVGKTVGLYALALVLFRLMGKRTLGDMEALDFVIVLVIAEVVGAPLADPQLSVAPAVIAVVSLALLQIVLAYASLQSARVEKVLEGESIVVVKGGRVLEDNLRRARLSPEELAGRLREKGFVDVSDIELATLEADGLLSAIPKREAAPVTPRFLGREASTTLLLDGEPDPAGLRKAGLTIEDLRRAVRRRGLSLEDADEVFLDPRGTLRVTLDLSRRLRKRRSARRVGPHPAGPARWRRRGSGH